jgi:hypothetical protein
MTYYGKDVRMAYRDGPPGIVPGAQLVLSVAPGRFVPFVFM